MTAQDLLNEAMPRLTREHLQRYIHAYETNTASLGKGCMVCAVMAMCGMHGTDAGVFGEETPEYRTYRRAHPIERSGCRESPSKWIPSRVGHGLDSPDMHDAFCVVEAVFEGWVKNPIDDPRRLIYDACVVELARRDSLSVAPLLLDAVHTQPIT